MAKRTKSEISKEDLNFVKNLEDLGQTRDVQVPRAKKKSVEEEMADLIKKTEGMLETGKLKIEELPSFTKLKENVESESKTKFKVDTLEGFKEQLDEILKPLNVKGEEIDERSLEERFESGKFVLDKKFSDDEFEDVLKQLKLEYTPIRKTITNLPSHLDMRLINEGYVFFNDCLLDEALAGGEVYVIFTKKVENLNDLTTFKGGLNPWRNDHVASHILRSVLSGTTIHFDNLFAHVGLDVKFSLADLKKQFFPNGIYIYGRTYLIEKILTFKEDKAKLHLMERLDNETYIWGTGTSDLKELINSDELFADGEWGDFHFASYTTKKQDAFNSWLQALGSDWKVDNNNRQILGLVDLPHNLYFIHTYLSLIGDLILTQSTVLNESTTEVSITHESKYLISDRSYYNTKGVYDASKLVFGNELSITKRSYNGDFGLFSEATYCPTMYGSDQISFCVYDVEWVGDISVSVVVQEDNVLSFAFDQLMGNKEALPWVNVANFLRLLNSHVVREISNLGTVKSYGLGPKLEPLKAPKDLREENPIFDKL